MDAFVAAAVGFPTLFLTAALVVVIGFWLLVLAGALEHDGFDVDIDAHALHLGGVPIAVSGSLLIAVAWFLSLTSGVLLFEADEGGTDAVLPLGFAALGWSLVGAWALVRLFVRPLAKLFPDEPGPSRQDFIGLTCTIRTGRVDGDFGQAEVTARDGSTALVQVRQTDAYVLVSGSTGLLYAYDEAGEFFWVAPY
ncbi:hypothetical protein ACH41E_34165 [Streptomyces sp. NPDC020412]|uniref:hypothetical protein n=1 Tax=Streptomyces sp. NPDC020412 TaxID=3365073 RepID=UPI0037A8C2C4